MELEETIDYQQTEIDTAKANIEDRLEHISGRVRFGILQADKLQEHQNQRVEAYLEGYADALAYAAREVDQIQNIVEHLPQDALETTDTEEPDP